MLADAECVFREGFCGAQIGLQKLQEIILRFQEKTASWSRDFATATLTTTTPTVLCRVRWDRSSGCRMGVREHQTTQRLRGSYGFAGT